jgi:hypothetical protein
MLIGMNEKLNCLVRVMTIDSKVKGRKVISYWKFLDMTKLDGPELEEHRKVASAKSLQIMEIPPNGLISRSNWLCHRQSSTCIMRHRAQVNYQLRRFCPSSSLPKRIPESQ